MQGPVDVDPDGQVVVERVEHAVVVSAGSVPRLVCGHVILQELRQAAGVGLQVVVLVVGHVGQGGVGGGEQRHLWHWHVNSEQ